MQVNSSRYIFFLIAGLCFAGGCGQATPVTFDRVVRPISEQQMAERTHTTAPWNATLYTAALSRAGEYSPRLEQDVKGGFVPHHLISADTAAAFFSQIARQKPSTLVLIGPNHIGRGSGAIQTTEYDWKTPLGMVHSDGDRAKELSAGKCCTKEPDTFDEEHGIYSVVPFVAGAIPKARVLPIAITPGTPTSSLDVLIKELVHTLPDDAVIIGSVDFSHYMRLPVANFHDELSSAVIRAGDSERALALEVDSQETVYVVLELMKYYGTQHVAYEEHTNSADLVRAPKTELTTSHYVPYFVAGEPEANNTVTLLHFGDLMLDRSVAERIREHSAAWLFEELAGIEQRFFRGMDMIVANLEGPFVEKRIHTTKEIAFRFDPVLIPTLKQLNFSLFTLANNHSLDMGHAGFAESKAHLDAAGIPSVGQQLYVNEDSMYTKQIGGATIAFFALDDTIVPVDVSDAEERVRALDERADYTVVTIHWGQEYQPLSHPRQRALAYALIDAGADAVIGHHPHVVQEMEVYNGAPIFYSLGNFVFDQYFSEPTQQGLAAGLVFTPQETRAYVFPLESTRSQVRLMPYEKAKTLWTGLLERSRVEDGDVSDFMVSIQQ